MGSRNIASQLNVGDIQGNSYFRIEEDGSIQMLGNASMWDDLRFPSTQTKLGSNLKPDFDQTNVGLLFPQNDATEVVYVNVQMSHTYKIGTSIFPHVHFVQSAATVPVFKMAYRWYDKGASAIAAFTTIATTGLVFPYTSGSIHQVAVFPNIVPTVVGLSSMLDIKLYREDNVVTGDVLVKEFDIHYEIDSLGSRAVETK